MDLTNMLWYPLVGMTCLVIGYLFGARHASRARRRALQELNAQSLDLLDVKASLAAARQDKALGFRKEKLLKLSLLKLKEANGQNRRLRDLLSRQKNQHFIELARLKLHAVQARETAEKATSIARQATTRLKRLEMASPATQTIEAPEPKSYGSGEPVTVRVVDQARPDKLVDTPSTVSNRDSDRLSRLASSNESRIRAQL